MPTETQLAKASFTVQGGSGTRIEVQFNPVSLEHVISNQLQGEGGQAAQYVSSSSAKLSMELVFDTTDSGDDVRTKTYPVACLMKPAGGEQGDDAARRAPPVVLFEWGAFRFQGMVESFKETIDYFASNGVPLRATVQLSLSSQDHVFDELGQTNQAGGVAGGLQLGGGDPASVAALGGAPDAARAIASANGLESLRFGGGAGLSVGGGISIKAPAAFAAGGISAGAGFGLGVSASLSAGPMGGQMSAGVSASAGAFAGLKVSTSGGASMAELDAHKLLGGGVSAAARNATQFDLSGKALTQGPSCFRTGVGGSLQFDPP